MLKILITTLATNIFFGSVALGQNEDVGFLMVDGHNAEVDGKNFPHIGAVIRIKYADGKVFSKGCTGTNICSKAVLTAGHCFLDPGDETYFLTDHNVEEVLRKYSDAYSVGTSTDLCAHSAGFCSKLLRQKTNPQYEDTLLLRNRRYDVAVAELEVGSSFAKYPRLAAENPKSCLDFVAVGYGLESFADDAPKGRMHYGLLRYEDVIWGPWNSSRGYLGTLRLVSSPVEKESSGKEPMVNYGDSGGPLFYYPFIFNETNNVIDDYVISGIAQDVFHGIWKNEAIYVPISMNTGFIRSVMKEYCGDGYE